MQKLEDLVNKFYILEELAKHLTDLEQDLAKQIRLAADRGQLSKQFGPETAEALLSRVEKLEQSNA